MSESIKGNIVFNVTRTFLSVLYPMLTFMYVTRVLSVDGLGQVHFVKNLTAYFCLAASLGISYYGVREGAKLKDKDEFSKLFWEILSINIVATTLSTICFITTAFITPSLADYKSLMLLNIMSVVLNGLSCEWVLTSKEKYKTLALSSMFIQAICLIGMFIIIREEDDVIPYALVLIISSYAIAFFNWINIARFKLVNRVKIKELNLCRHLKPVFLMFAMLISIDIFTMLDTTMIGFIKGDYSVGIYSAAIKMPRLINSVIASVGAVLVPRLSYYYEFDRINFMKYVNYAMEFVFFATIPCAVFLFFMADDITLLICGSKYVDSIQTVRLLSPITLIIPISVLFNNQVFIPMRLERYVFQSVTVGALVNIIANSFLIPFYGHNGAAIASVLAEFVVMSICLLHVKKELKIDSILAKYSKKLLKSIPLIVVLVISRLLIEGGVVRLIISMACFGVMLLILNRQEMLLFIKNKKSKV